MPRKSVRRKYREFAIIIESGVESGFVAHTIGVEWCVTQGRTIRETCKNMGECIELHLEENEKENRRSKSHQARR